VYGIPYHSTRYGNSDISCSSNGLGNTSCERTSW
jgi:hypothetical protein